jgi:hypothetical protein
MMFFTEGASAFALSATPCPIPRASVIKAWAPQSFNSETAFSGFIVRLNDTKTASAFKIPKIPTTNSTELFRYKPTLSPRLTPSSRRAWASRLALEFKSA